MSEKQYLDAQTLLEDSFKLAAMVHDSGYLPTFIVAVWRGGAPMGIAVQELFAHYGVETDHIAIRTAAYHGIDSSTDTVRVYSLNYLIKKIQHTDRLLIVDDVFDTGKSIDAIIATIHRLARRNAPSEIRVAVPYFKPTRNKSARVPDYYLHETEAWLKFPHSVEGLTPDEVRLNRPELHRILQQANTSPD